MTGAAPKGHSRHSGFDRDPFDWYVEPPSAVDQVLDALDLAGVTGCLIYDPACGMGTSLDAAAARGLPTIGSDVVDRGARARHAWIRADFLRDVDLIAAFIAEHLPPGFILVILSNPPYGRLEENMPRGDTYAERFIRRAHALGADRILMVLNGKILWSERRYRLFEVDHPPTELLFCSERPSMPPGAELEHLRAEGRAHEGGAIDYLWIYWERGAEPRRPRWLRPSSIPAEDLQGALL
jgi:hypothetical protein